MRRGIVGQDSTVDACKAKPRAQPSLIFLTTGSQKNWDLCNVRVHELDSRPKVPVVPGAVPDAEQVRVGEPYHPVGHVPEAVTPALVCAYVDVPWVGSPVRAAHVTTAVAQCQ